LISFRNHVVTLLAVFLALAAGIALGGGPLSEVGRSPLTSAAPAEKKADAAVTAGDAFAVAVAGELYGGGLEGHPVTVLTLPGADKETVSGLIAQVERAGGTVAATYAAENTLVDPSEKTLVDTLGSQLMTQVDGEIADQAAPTYVRMGQILGTAIATPTDAAAASDDASAAIRQALVGAELAVTPEGDPSRSPLVLVVLGDDVDGDVLAGLMSGLAAKALGVVAVGDTASEDVAGLRSSPLAADVATVDGAERSLGRVTAALALIRSLSTKGGAFGASGSDGAAPLG
jgi:hypothetical protein